MDEEGNYKKTETFLHKGGVQEFVELMCKEKQHLHPEVKVKQTRATYAVSRDVSVHNARRPGYPFALCVSPIDMRFSSVSSHCVSSRDSHGVTGRQGRGRKTGVGGAGEVLRTTCPHSTPGK